MATLLPLIHDLLPMILPSQIHIKRARDLAPPDLEDLDGSHLVPLGAGASSPPVLGIPPPPAADAPKASQATGAATSVNRPATAATGGDGVKVSSMDRAHEEVPPPPRGHTPRPPQGGKPVARGRMVCRDAIVNMTDKMCASVVFAGPRFSSAVHHNSEHDAIIYVVSGRGALATSPPDDDEDDTGGNAAAERHELGPGDFAFIPAWTEHQLVNDTDEQAVWVVVQGGPAPIVVDLTEWGGDEVKPETKQGKK